MIPEEQYVRPQLMYFQRAARTDKSVSAIRQIVSMKLRESILDNLSSLNQKLPSDIRVMGAKRVIATFDAKNHCDARTYSYLMPSFTLAPANVEVNESYTVDKATLKSFNDVLQGYVGTHVFHNFTHGKGFKEDSASRVIRFIYCSEPFYPSNQKELEFVVVRVKGQSFMIHQIRKMIGLAVAIVKGYASEDHLRRAFEEKFMDVPKAPGLGLMLEEVHFDRYNRKYGGDGHHEPIEWEAQNDEIEKFKDAFVYSAVVEAELKEKSMLSWLETLPLHSYGETRDKRPNECGTQMRSQEPDESTKQDISRGDAEDHSQTNKRFKNDDGDNYLFASFLFLLFKFLPILSYCFMAILMNNHDTRCGIVENQESMIFGVLSQEIKVGLRVELTV